MVHFLLMMRLIFFACILFFLPRINAQLEVFRHSYCQHRLRTEQNRSPLQLWMSGMLQQLDEEAILGLREIPFEVNVQYNKNLPHTCIMVPL